MFNVAADGVPVYDSGSSFPVEYWATKAYVYSGSGNSLEGLPTILDQVAAKLGADRTKFTTKELNFVGGKFKRADAPVFDRFILVNTDPNDFAVNQAVERLVAKHPDNTTVVAPNAEENVDVLSGILGNTGGRAKYEVVGHATKDKLGPLDDQDIFGLVSSVAEYSKTSIDKLTLVGCDTACGGHEDGLAGKVADIFREEGIKTSVKGYKGYVAVDEQGHKKTVIAGAKEALGKDNPSDSKSQRSSSYNDADVPPSHLHSALERVEGTQSVIWQAFSDKIINYETADYLEHVKNKAIYQMQFGPVLFGEQHNTPLASLLVGQLTAETNLRRILLETMPLGETHPFARKEIPVLQLQQKGYSSMDEYFSNFDPSESQTNFFKIAQKNLAKETLKLYDGDSGELHSRVINSGLHFDFIDVGRRHEGEDSDDEFAERNFAMAEIIKGDPKYQLPGVIGIVGMEHLRTYAADDGFQEPALQQMIGIPQNRIYDLVSVFDDFELNLEYYPWSQLSNNRSLKTPMSTTRPYKLKKNPYGTEIEEFFVPRKNTNHLVLNAVGDAALPEIARIKEEHPSSTIVFDAFDDGELDYSEGDSGSYSFERPTKVFLLADDQTRPVNTARWLTLAGVKMNRAPSSFILKELRLSSDGGFKLQSPPAESVQEGEGSVEVNNNVF